MKTNRTGSKERQPAMTFVGFVGLLGVVAFSVSLATGCASTRTSLSKNACPYCDGSGKRSDVSVEDLERKNAPKVPTDDPLAEELESADTKVAASESRGGNSVSKIDNTNARADETTRGQSGDSVPAQLNWYQPSEQQTAPSGSNDAVVGSVVPPSVANAAKTPPVLDHLPASVSPAVDPNAQKSSQSTPNSTPNMMQGDVTVERAASSPSNSPANGSSTPSSSSTSPTNGSPAPTDEKSSALPSDVHSSELPDDVKQDSFTVPEGGDIINADGHVITFKDAPKARLENAVQTRSSAVMRSVSRPSEIAANAGPKTADKVWASNAAKTTARNPWSAEGLPVVDASKYRNRR